MISKILIGIIITMLLGGGAYYYFTDKKLAKLQTEIGALNVVAETQKESINTLIDSASKIQEASLTLEKALNSAEEVNITLKSKLSKHDLTRLSIKKSGLIEPRINKGTNNAFRNLEAITDNSSK